MRFLPSRVLFSVVWTFSAASRSDRTGRIAQHSIWSSDWGTICAEAWLSGLSPLQCWTALWRVPLPQGHSWKMMEVDVGIDMNRLSILLDLIFVHVEFIARRKALEMIGLSDQLESAEMLIQAHLDYREARDGLSTFEDDWAILEPPCGSFDST